MRRWTRLALVQIMACRLSGAKPSSKPVLGYCQLEPWEQTPVKCLSKCKTFHSRKCIWKYRLRNGGPVEMTKHIDAWTNVAAHGMQSIIFVSWNYPHVVLGMELIRKNDICLDGSTEQLTSPCLNQIPENSVQLPPILPPFKQNLCQCKWFWRGFW